MKEKVLLALDIAIEKHKGQVRKGTDIPYIKHIIDVYEILRKQGVDDETLIVGILHDTVEDTDMTLEKVKELFGEYVCSGVGAESEKKHIKDYMERKKEHLDRVAASDANTQMVNCADKLANLRDMYNDYIRLGETLFERFNSGKQNILAYYKYAVDHYNIKDKWVYQEFKSAYEKFASLVNTNK